MCRCTLIFCKPASMEIVTLTTRIKSSPANVQMHLNILSNGTKVEIVLNDKSIYNVSPMRKDSTILRDTTNW